MIREKFTARKGGIARQRDVDNWSSVLRSGLGKFRIFPMNEDREQARRYRYRAVECRAIAENTRDRHCQQILTGIAEDYERMARTWEAVAASDISRHLSH
jgi:hypothetical protein